jgi:hypothetical protein
MFITFIDSCQDLVLYGIGNRLFNFSGCALTSALA